MSEHDFNREYLGIPMGAHTSLFNWDMFDRTTRIHTPLVPPGPAFKPLPEEAAVPIANPFQRLKASGGLR